MTCPPTTHAHGTLHGPLHGTLADAAFVRELFAMHDFDGVLHFAALSVVAESMRDPRRDYSHNVAATLNLPPIMREFEVPKAAGEDIPVTARRPGDPAHLVAGSKHARAILGWASRYTKIADMIETVIRSHGTESFRGWIAQESAQNQPASAAAEPGSVQQQRRQG